MTIHAKEIEKLQAYLHQKLGTDRLKIVLPKREGQPVELCVQDGKNWESIGTVYRDEEDGEVSYAISLTILQEDLL
ncbi:DUF3126 family protein [Commensalibacter oyaizuii]|uniref:DUF3126 family protein n=1 Tax=Commensalibacter oyaizuii TaxID=3043873 RepID=A0ABT6Q1R2_9PROT|nr:DUF3126 family protein [Commensalibacter sp. TBRC 16381]MDI2091056.1 DUF3126 family protein [Commensalibacter sp. TBRC 16381]